MINNRGLRTPLPPPPDEEAGLTFKPSRRPWVAWLRSLDHEFARDGRSVQIAGAGPIPVSPTPYPGQSTVWFRSDQDTLYRFEKRVRVLRLEVVTITGSVAHGRLLPSLPTSQNSAQPPRQRYQVDRATVVYTRDAHNIMFHGIPLEVRMHTGVTLGQIVSRNQRPGDRILNTNPANMFYTVEVYVETQQFEWKPYRAGLTSNSFELLTPNKIDTLSRRTIKPGPTVVSAEGISPARRRQLNSREEDIHE